MNNDMRVMEDLGFRALHHKLVYIHCPDDIENLKNSFQVMDGAEGVLTYCYVEDGLGLSFYILNSARVEDGKIVKGPDVHEECCRLRFGELEQYSVVPENDMNVSINDYSDVINDIHSKFEPEDENIRRLHMNKILDGSRNIEFPDFISVIFKGTGTYPELAWVKCTGEGKDYFEGEVVQPPRQKLGVHFGDHVTFRPYEGSDKKIYFIADRTGESAEK